MLAADHRLIRQVPTSTMASAGLTPMLQSRTVHPDPVSKSPLDIFIKKSNLKEIAEEKEDDANKKPQVAPQKTVGLVKNNLKGL